MIKQLRLPHCGGGRKDRHPRAHLFRTMTLLGEVEDRALTAAEDEEVEDWEKTHAELDRATTQAVTFYQHVIAPVYRDWWLH